MEVQVDQGVHAGIDHQGDASASAAVPTVGATQGLELLPENRDTTVTAIAALHVEYHPVDKTGHPLLSFLGPARTTTASWERTRPAVAG
jgi:hypothetical protein